MRMKTASGLGVVVEQSTIDADHVYIESDWAGFSVSKTDLAAALDAIEGFEVTYTPPREDPVEVIRNLPNGSYFGWDDAPGEAQYFKDSNGAIRYFKYPRHTYPLDSFADPHLFDRRIVVYGGEDD